ncbi:DUF2570 family protein [Phocoenobacter skyensis]|uniref:DUF2570 domain-containing protein n=1 Tax=Phocoenobacter skyensis TaxID=97481 RepID=A0A1H7XJF0_9PAST|nr:DUF2570 family protein [Pasteurella skyensis]MDP8184393.1 DUF2570 family protein [Pasteurella skyensis]QLB22605.1 hypothetical protein A6B44_05045 [Pasteurella skyensis]SEM33785.1 Protein of unknown function [Pasteurella skyensis]
MFSRFKIIVVGVAIVLIFGLCVVFSYQYQMISSLKDENRRQSELISKQESANKKLIRSLELEREAVIKEQAIINQLKVKSNEANQIINKLLKKDTCANTNLHSDVIKQLQSLSSN